jgi:hypothetical protein
VRFKIVAVVEEPSPLFIRAAKVMRRDLNAMTHRFRCARALYASTPPLCTQSILPRIDMDVQINVATLIICGSYCVIEVHRARYTHSYILLVSTAGQRRIVGEAMFAFD